MYWFCNVLSLQALLSVILPRPHNHLSLMWLLAGSCNLCTHCSTGWWYLQCCMSILRLFMYVAMWDLSYGLLMRNCLQRRLKLTTAVTCNDVTIPAALVAHSQWLDLHPPLDMLSHVQLLLVAEYLVPSLLPSFLWGPSKLGKVLETKKVSFAQQEYTFKLIHYGLIVVRHHYMWQLIAGFQL